MEERVHIQELELADLNQHGLSQHGLSLHFQNHPGIQMPADDRYLLDWRVYFSDGSPAVILL